METDQVFPADWTEWRQGWQEWKSAHVEDLRPTSFRFPGKNFMADEILGTWSVKGRNVELSEVTFPNLSERDENGQLRRFQVRSIGITFESDASSSPLVCTFGELERELGLVDA